MAGRPPPLVIVVHEDAVFPDLIREVFGHYQLAARIAHAAKAAELAALLDRDGYSSAGGLVIVAAPLQNRGGLQAVRAATHHRSNLPVMLLTMEADFLDECLARESGALAVMELPVDIDDFRFIVARAREMLAVSCSESGRLDIA